MKKTKLFKSLLVAAGLLVGANAWAQTTTLLEYGTADVAWSATNLADWTAGGSPTIKDGGYVEISGGNGSYATSTTISPTANAIINLQAVWRGRSNTGRAFSAGNGSYFRFGNIIVAQNDQDKKHGYGFTGLANIKDVTTFEAGSYRTDIENCTWLLIDMEINTGSNTLVSFSIKSEDGKTTYVTKSNIALSDADYTTVAFGYQKSGSVSYTNKEDLKSVKITQTIKETTYANYTVKYVCGTTEVKEAQTRRGEVGANIILSASDTENFYANDKKYIYVSSDVEGKTVSEGAVVTVTFREAEVYAWTANSNVGSYTISGTVFEGDQASVKYPLYVLNEGKLWTKTAISQVFAQSFNVTENNQELTLEYTETEIENVVFLTEMEDVEGMGVVDNGNAAARSSKRAAGYSANGKTKFASLPVGKYQIYARFYSPTSAGGNYKFYTGNREVWAQTTGNANATDANTEILLAQDDNELLLGQTGATAAVDFVYIVKTADLTDEEIAEIQAADVKAEKAARVFNIIGLGNDWDTDHQMTQSSIEGEEDIYTFTTTMNVVGGEEDKYFEYKLRQNSDWNGYQLPAEGQGNKSWKDQVNGIGIYTLTFTADVANHTLECEAVKSDFTYVVVGSKKVDGNNEESALFDGSWNTATSTDILAKGADGKFTLTKEVELEAQYVEFKIVAKNGDNVLKWFGNGTYTDGAENNANYNFTSDGTYYVKFTFDGGTVYATAEQKHAWTVAGSDATLFGTTWAADASANDMTRNAEGIWTITYENKTLTAGTIEYKIVQDHSWANAYGFNGENATATIPADGEYNVTFTFNADTKATGCEIVPTTVTKNITIAKYATYCSPYALDFSESNLTAYIATRNGDEVSFAEVSSVPANTGVLLKANAAGDFTIKTTFTSNTDVSKNALVGVTTDTHVDAGAFVLMNGSKGVGFYKTTNEAGFTVGANTAYIPATASARTFIGFDFSDATAIEGVAAEKMMNGEVYNLQGQRVMNAKKGLYIINGKKVVIK